MRSAYPYRDLSREEFDDVLRMLAEGFSTRRGRRAALVHHDAVNHRVRARRGAALTALTSGGAIPDNADYRVLLEPGETLIGTVNEDFAIESMAGEVFQLGNASWRILQINSGTVRVEDAQGQPPGIPFWLGEAPGRTAELSRAVSTLRSEIEKKLEAALERGESDIGAAEQALADWLKREPGFPRPGRANWPNILARPIERLGVIPSQDKLVLERFFDESGGMQLVIHSPFGIRLNRAWGLALRKRFCRSFNFELQAAATDDAIVLSLGTQHSFPLDEVFAYLNSKTVRDLLVQALSMRPCFPSDGDGMRRAPSPAAATRRAQDTCAAAADGIGKPAGRCFSRSARLPGKYRGRPGDSSPSAGPANDRRLPDRSDGHRRLDRSAQADRERQHSMHRSRSPGTFSAGTRNS